ncbi:twin-arginine translocase subunit TatC [Eubacteriales bacterium OttesenSCG-928-A19]|nr:twin-arginine translocase subunit TatC [Eubacteriales bacterium OttesenSCG-928-A19]
MMRGALALWKRSRQAVLAVAGVFAAAFVLAFLGSDPLLVRLQGLLPPDVPLYQSYVGEGLAAKLMLGVCVALPVAAYVGLCLLLYRLRRGRWAVLSVAALLLFAAGVAFAGICLLPPALRLLTGMFAGAFTLHLTLYGYTMFCMTFFLLSGALFETPLALLLLHGLGLVRAASLRRQRAKALIGALIVMAVLTPTQDVLTLVIAMLPLIVLYEASIVMLAALERRDGKAVAASRAS